jgi:mRNA interferase MazF
MVSRGDVWLVLPEGTEGGTPDARPCVVLSPPELHDHLGVVTVAPLGPGAKPAAFQVPVTLGTERSVIRLEHIRTIDKRALTRQIGTIERKTLSAALATLREMFAD